MYCERNRSGSFCFFSRRCACTIIYLFRSSRNPPSVFCTCVSLSAVLPTFCTPMCVCVFYMYVCMCTPTPLLLQEFWACSDFSMSRGESVGFVSKCIYDGRMYIPTSVLVKRTRMYIYKYILVYKYVCVYRLPFRTSLMTRTCQGMKQESSADSCLLLFRLSALRRTHRLCGCIPFAPPAAACPHRRLRTCASPRHPRRDAGRGDGIPRGAGDPRPGLR